MTIIKAPNDIQIFQFDHWELFLHPHQNYIGRVYLWAKRPDLVDMMDMNSDEWKSLQIIGPQIRNALQKAFNPDHFNYASLGNITRHLHIHFIPRYQKIVNFENTVFEDKRWANDYEPYDREFHVSHDVKLKIADIVLSYIENN